MFAIHFAFLVFVAVYATKGCEGGRSLPVAVGALSPFISVFSRVNGEELSIMVKRRTSPCRLTVAVYARSGEAAACVRCLIV